MQDIVSQHRGWVGGALILSIALLFTMTGAWVFGNPASPVVEWWHVRRLRTFLYTLSPPEKAVLKQYIDRNTSTVSFTIGDGVVGGLVKKRILWQSGNASTGFYFDYNLQPWAWEYLQKNPRLVQ